MNEAYLRDLHREVREELVRVDGKCSILLAVSGLSVSLVGAALINGDIAIGEMTGFGRVVFYSAGSLVLAGIAAFIAALTPAVRSPGVSHDALAYFGHIAAYQDLATFREALEGLTHGRDDREVEQAFTLSRIVVRKYRLLTVGTGSFSVGVIIGIVAALVH